MKNNNKGMHFLAIVVMYFFFVYLVYVLKNDVDIYLAGLVLTALLVVKMYLKGGSKEDRKN